ncbi:MAG: type II secretion system protein [bacterium]|nr:type II secretion system protein [bacterium]
MKNKMHSTTDSRLVTYDCPSRGMTLLETLVWVSITSMIMLAITQSIQAFYRTNTYATEQGAAITSAQRGIESGIKTMREAAYSSNGAWPIISMASSSFSFYADIDEDPFVERIRFFIQGGSLMRGVIDPSGDPPVYTNPETLSSVSDYVRNNEKDVAMFQYYDVNGNLMTDLTKIAEVRFVQTTVVVNINPDRLPNQFTLRSTAALRNLK